MKSTTTDQTGLSLTMQAIAELEAGKGKRFQTLQAFIDDLHSEESSNLPKPSDVIIAHRAEIRAIVHTHHASNPRIVESIVCSNDEGSNLSILIDPDSQTTLFDIAAISLELKKLLGVRVEVLTPNALPERFRTKLIEMAQPI